MGKDAVNKTIKPAHPGQYIKNKILPANLSVKEAAKVLGVGRPALSNLLNGNAALSPEMAMRLEKTFSANGNELIKMQAEFDQYEISQTENKITVQTYVPEFLTIKAIQIESWSEDSIEARTLLAALLRKLVFTTGKDLTFVDFPAYDNSQRKGWDGLVETETATPWIPVGKSGWEFGTDDRPKKKAEDDYNTRIKSVPAEDREKMHFVFVTPKNWTDKAAWANEKQKLNEWKSVRAYDASDLEQWLSQSFTAQGWMAEHLKIPQEDIQTLENYWQKWSSVSDPSLVKELFSTSVGTYSSRLNTWLQEEPINPFLISADSKEEALAFLACLFESEEFVKTGHCDQAIIFKSPSSLDKLSVSSAPFIPIVYTDDVEKEIGGLYKKRHTIVVRSKNVVEKTPDITLDLLGHDTLKSALKKMGFSNDEINRVVRETGYSATILRRRLSKIEAIRTPEWTKDKQAIKKLIPMMLLGSWHSKSSGDTEILSFLAGCDYTSIEDNIFDLLKFEDSPVWSAGQYRGVVSKIDVLFGVSANVTEKDLNNFFFAAEIVLSEDDPALELPEDSRWAANLYGKSRNHSGTLRKGICETLVLLSVEGNNLFKERLGIDVRSEVDQIIHRLLSPLTEKKLHSQTNDLPFYAEASPTEFLSIIEHDLKNDKPKIHTLMKPVTGLFSTCARTGLLWALESVVWKSEYLLRVCQILAKLAELKIDDNWVNKPENTLKAIFRSWMPQTSATLEERKKVLKKLVERYPNIGWEICIDQLQTGHQEGHYNYKPHWRTDALGFGQPSGGKERSEFVEEAFELALSFQDHSEMTLADLIKCSKGCPPAYQEKIWSRVITWIEEGQGEQDKANLLESIRRSIFFREEHQKLADSAKMLVIRAIELLTSEDPVIKNQWLFKKQWIDYAPIDTSFETSSNDFDYRKNEEKVYQLRVKVINEIWKAEKTNGIFKLIENSEASFVIGWCMVETHIKETELVAFLIECLKSSNPKMDDLIRGLLQKSDGDKRMSLLKAMTPKLKEDDLIRLLKCAPFESSLWVYIDSLGEDVAEFYWKKVQSFWPNFDLSKLNNVVDRLLKVGRPIAAFNAAQHHWSELETNRLYNLLYAVATQQPKDEYDDQIASYDITSAFQSLNERPGITQEKKAELEFLYIKALDDSDYGLPNLERELGKNPPLFIELLALMYKRNDGKGDPAEFMKMQPSQRGLFGSLAYSVFKGINHIPGTDEKGNIDPQALKSWIIQTRKLAKEYGREKVCDHTIGEILAKAPADDNGTWPCKELRDVLEELSVDEVGVGIEIGIYNKRGVHWGGSGGDQERELAKKYRNWSKKLAFDYPFVSNILEKIATSYDRDAEREASRSAVEKRIGHI